MFSRDGKGHLTFEDLLDLLSAFSEQAPRDIKVFYAFKIYGKILLPTFFKNEKIKFSFFNFGLDFDGDRYIGIADLEQAARLLTRNELSAEEISQIAEKVIEEADVDGDGKLSYMEFEHVILRAPDFLTTFHIRI